MNKTQLFTQITKCKILAKKHFDEYVRFKHIFQEPKYAEISYKKYIQMIDEIKICKLVLKDI